MIKSLPVMLLGFVVPVVALGAWLVHVEPWEKFLPGVLKCLPTFVEAISFRKFLPHDRKKKVSSTAKQNNQGKAYLPNRLPKVTPAPKKPAKKPVKKTAVAKKHQFLIPLSQQRRKQPSPPSRCQESID